MFSSQPFFLKLPTTRINLAAIAFVQLPNKSTNRLEVVFLGGATETFGPEDTPLILDAIDRFTPPWDV